MSYFPQFNLSFTEEKNLFPNSMISIHFPNLDKKNSLNLKQEGTKTNSAPKSGKL